MGQITSSDNNVVVRANKDLTRKERTTKFLKCVHTKTYQVLNLLEDKHPTYQPVLRHFTRVFDDFIEKYLDGYRPNYPDIDKRNLKKEESAASKNNFWREKIIIQEIKGRYPTFLDNGSLGPVFTDNDVKLFKYLRIKSRRLLENIGQEYKPYWEVSNRFSLTFDDLLQAFYDYYGLKNIDKLQILSLQAKENPETADDSSEIELSKRQKTVTKGKKHTTSRAKKRTKGQLPFPDLDPNHEKNRTRQQMKVSLPPNLIEVVNKMVKNEEFSRNEWIEYLIEKELRVQYPYLLQNDMTLENIA